MSTEIKSTDSHIELLLHSITVLNSKPADFQLNIGEELDFSFTDLATRKDTKNVIIFSYQPNMSFILEYTNLIKVCYEQFIASLQPNDHHDLTYLFLKKDGKAQFKLFKRLHNHVVQTFDTFVRVTGIKLNIKEEGFYESFKRNKCSEIWPRRTTYECLISTIYAYTCNLDGVLNYQFDRALTAKMRESKSLMFCILYSSYNQISITSMFEILSKTFFVQVETQFIEAIKIYSKKVQEFREGELATGGSTSGMEDVEIEFERELIQSDDPTNPNTSGQAKENETTKATIESQPETGLSNSTELHQTRVQETEENKENEEDNQKGSDKGQGGGLTDTSEQRTSIEISTAGSAVEINLEPAIEGGVCKEPTQINVAPSTGEQNHENQCKVDPLPCEECADTESNCYPCQESPARLDVVLDRINELVDKVKEEIQEHPGTGLIKVFPGSKILNQDTNSLEYFLMTTPFPPSSLLHYLNKKGLNVIMGNLNTFNFNPAHYNWLLNENKEDEAQKYLLSLEASFMDMVEGFPVSHYPESKRWTFFKSMEIGCKLAFREILEKERESLKQESDKDIEIEDLKRQIEDMRAKLISSNLAQVPGEVNEIAKLDSTIYKNAYQNLAQGQTQKKVEVEQPKNTGTIPKIPKSTPLTKTDSKSSPLVDFSTLDF